MGNETDKIIDNLFYSFLQRYQKNLEESMIGSQFVFDCVDWLYYKLHKISLNRGGSYKDFLKWPKNKTVTINPKNNDDKCIQYAIAVALNHKQVKSHTEKISNIKKSDSHLLKKIVACFLWKPFKMIILFISS